MPNTITAGSGITAPPAPAVVAGVPQQNGVAEISADAIGPGVTQARAAGYSDQEIVDHLTPRAPYKFSEALKAGYTPTEILDYLAPQPSGLVDNLKQGAADVLGGVGKTMQTNLGAGPVSKWLQSKAGAVAPANYVPSPIIDKQGFHASGILPTLARTAPEAAGAIIAAGLAPEELGVAGPIAAGAGAYTLMNAGNEAQQAAATRTGNPKATPTTGDVVRGDLTAAGSGLVSALPISRFLPDTAPITATSFKGVAGALRKLGVTAADQGAASGASDVVNQVGQSIGTPGGLKVDPTQVANSAASGAVTGTAFGAKNAARETLDATKYRNITPDLQPAAAQFANRMQQAADGENLNAGVIGGGAALRAGADAFNKASAAVHSELGDAVSDLRSRAQLPTDANNVLNAALSGRQPSTSDYATLTVALKGDPQADNVMNLVRQAHVADIVENSGSLSHNKFVGGLSSLPTLLNTHTAEKAGIAALMAGAAVEGGAGHLITFSPPAIAALAGIAGAARIADRLTGARSPAGRFVRNFADGTTPVRETVPAPQASPSPAVSPTGPRIPPAPQPWGSGVSSGPVVPPVANGSIITPQVRAQMDARATLEKLKAANAPAPTQAPTTINPLALPKNITAPAATVMRGAALAQKLKAASNPTPAINPLALPKSITGPAANIMRGAVLAQKLKGANDAPQSTQAQVQQYQPVTVSKAKDGTASADTGSGKLPIAPYSSLPAPEAAQRILRDQLAAHVPVKNSGAFLSKTIAVLNTLRDKVQAVTQAVPNIPAVDVARFEGVKTQKAAIDYREHLKREYPQAAPVLDRVFSNDAIAGQWSQKR